MNIKTYRITGNTRKLINTELMFFAAAAKAADMDLMHLVIENTDPKKSIETLENHVDATLRSMKRQGIIELYVFSRDTSKVTEIEYLNNKFPSLKVTDDANSFYTVKV